MTRLLAMLSAFLLAFAVDITPCFAQHPPNGSYRLTCDNIRVSGTTLHADCRAHNGQYRATTLDLSKCDPSRGVYNDGGNLRCAPKPPPIPGGPYLRTCRDVRVHGSALFAMCRDDQRKERSTGLTLPCAGDITNVNGKLVCK